MSSGRPLFPGATVEDELHLTRKVNVLYCPVLTFTCIIYSINYRLIIFKIIQCGSCMNFKPVKYCGLCINSIFVKVLGTPSEADWPGISTSEVLASHRYVLEPGLECTRVAGPKTGGWAWLTHWKTRRMRTQARGAGLASAPWQLRSINGSGL